LHLHHRQVFAKREGKKQRGRGLLDQSRLAPAMSAKAVSKSNIKVTHYVRAAYRRGRGGHVPDQEHVPLGLPTGGLLSQVLNSASQRLHVVAEEAESAVALSAEEPPHHVRAMAVINTELWIPSAAYGASVSLLTDHVL
jgi:hypothetical protein